MRCRLSHISFKDRVAVFLKIPVTVHGHVFCERKMLQDTVMGGSRMLAFFRVRWHNKKAAEVKRLRDQLSGKKQGNKGKENKGRKTKVKNKK